MFGEIGKLMGLVGKIKKELPELRERLAESQFTAEAGGGTVRATVNGQGKIASVEITPEALAAGDAEALAESVKKAVTAAQTDASAAMAAAMKELTGDMDIPGLEGIL